MSNPSATRYVIRADLPTAEHLPPQTVYWRDGRGWATRQLATVYTALDDVNTALDHGVPVADLRFCKVRTLKAESSVEAPSYTPPVPEPILLVLATVGKVTSASFEIPPGHPPVNVGDQVGVPGQVLTVTKIVGTTAQCSSHPQELYGL